MLETSQIHKCMDPEDKKLILKIIDESINRENEELRKIAARRMHALLKPPFAESFTGIRSSLARVHEAFKKDVEFLKLRIEEYPKCTTIKPIVTEIGFNIRSPKSEIPVPYSQRKLL